MGAVAHAGHVFHGPLGVTLSDLGDVVLTTSLAIVIWRITTTDGAWRQRYGLLAAGLLAIVIALASPLDRAAAETFAAHMVEHLLLMLVAAPLIAASRPELLLMRELPVRQRESLAVLEHRLEGRIHAQALIAGLSMFLALWLWHIPALFDLALRSEPAHFLQHASFLAGAILFWRFVLVVPPHGTAFFLPRALLVFTAMAYSGALGALLVFSQGVWYTGYFGTPDQLLADQQLSGVIMWLTGPPVYLGTLAWLVYVWLKRDERENALRAPVQSPRRVT